MRLSHVLKNLGVAALLGSGFSTASVAFADGYSCLSVDRNERIDVYFAETQSAVQSAASIEADRMVVIDPTVAKRNQHVATFQAADGLLRTDGAFIQALVDLNYPGSSRSGERVGGTTLGALQMIQLEVQVKGDIRQAGLMFGAQATYLKRSGFELSQDFDCVSFDGVRPPADLNFY